MTSALILLAGSGLLGCFIATLGIDLAHRGARSSRKLARPRKLSIGYE